MNKENRMSNKERLNLLEEIDSGICQLIKDYQASGSRKSKLEDEYNILVEKLREVSREHARLGISIDHAINDMSNKLYEK